MKLHETPDKFNTIPDELTALPIWACWRLRRKKYRGRERVICQPVHPATGDEPCGDRPNEWSTFGEVLQPRLRKPVEGIGLLVKQEDGLAVVPAAPVDLAERLGDAALYVEQAVGGGGLTIIVRAGSVLGAVTDRFVPLSGQPPYQEDGTAPTTACLDTVRTQSGHEPYQETALSGQTPYQENGVCLDKPRTLFSSSPLKDNYQDGAEKPVQEQLADYAREMIAQEGQQAGPRKWLYSVISILRANRVAAEEVTPHLLREFSAVAEMDVGEVYRMVVARWERWRHHEVVLADALRAVRADPRLLDGLRLADAESLLVAGMARFMGQEGMPFPLDQRLLAKVVGLADQQAASVLLAFLRNAGLIEVVEQARFTKQKSTVYRWTGPGAKTAEQAKVATPIPAPPARPLPPVQATGPEQALLPAAETPSPPPAAPPSPPAQPRRPGHSPTRSDTHPFPSLVFLGGYVEYAHHLAEVVLARRLGVTSLPNGFWAKSKHGAEYGRQVDLARNLAKEFSFRAVADALRTSEGKKVYSLAAAEWLLPLVKAAQVRLDQRETLAALPPPPPRADLPPAQARPAFAPKKSIKSVLSGL